MLPTRKPTPKPSLSPTPQPSPLPTTEVPTYLPTPRPTPRPSLPPTSAPTPIPTPQPSTTLSYTEILAIGLSSAGFVLVLVCVAVSLWQGRRWAARRIEEREKKRAREDEEERLKEEAFQLAEAKRLAQEAKDAAEAARVAALLASRQALALQGIRTDATGRVLPPRSSRPSTTLQGTTAQKLALLKGPPAAVAVGAPRPPDLPPPPLPPSLGDEPPLDLDEESLPRPAVAGPVAEPPTQTVPPEPAPTTLFASDGVAATPRDRSQNRAANESNLANDSPDINDDVTTTSRGSDVNLPDPSNSSRSSTAPETPQYSSSTVGATAADVDGAVADASATSDPGLETEATAVPVRATPAAPATTRPKQRASASALAAAASAGAPILAATTTTGVTASMIEALASPARAPARSPQPDGAQISLSPSSSGNKPMPAWVAAREQHATTTSSTPHTRPTRTSDRPSAGNNASGAHSAATEASPRAPSTPAAAAKKAAPLPAPSNIPPAPLPSERIAAVWASAGVPQGNVSSDERVIAGGGVSAQGDAFGAFMRNRLTQSRTANGAVSRNASAVGDPLPRLQPAVATAPNANPAALFLQKRLSQNNGDQNSRNQGAIL